MSSVDAKMAMFDLYETEYGIYNHLDGSTRRPLATVAFHEAESLQASDLLSVSAKIYVSKNIHSLFGLSLFEFLSLTKSDIEILVEISDSELGRKTALMDEMEANFKK